MTAAEERESAAARRFFLARTPLEGRPLLLERELEHARKVLRLGPGDRLIGLDGRGRAFPLRVERLAGKEYELAEDGPCVAEPAAGSPGASTRWVELALPLARGERSEALVESATQLGASAIQWILSERTPPRSREPSSARLERLERLAAEAVKQSRRAWLPELRAPLALGSLLEREALRLVLLDPSPRAPPLSAVLAAFEGELGTRARPLVLVAGPEGGFTPAEEEQLRAAGARPARLSPFVLRIETAAAAALAIALHLLGPAPG